MCKGIPMAEFEPLLSAHDAGRILGKSARTVHRLVDNGRLTVAQKLPGPNGPYLFRKADVEALLATPLDAA